MIAPTGAGQRKKAGVTPNRKLGSALCSSNTLTVYIGNITPVKTSALNQRPQGFADVALWIQLSATEPNQGERMVSVVKSRERYLLR
jgi:hypothetical protein